MAASEMGLYLQKPRGIGTGKIQDTATGFIYHLPTFNIELNAGFETEEYEFQNPVGYMAYGGKRIASEKPEASLTFRQQRPEVIELILGKKFETRSNVVKPAMREFTIPASGVVPAVATDRYGGGVVADEPTAKVSVVGEFGMSKELTRVDYATGPTTVDEFAVGAGYELIFHQDMAGKNGTAIADEAHDSVLELGETPIGLYNVRAMFVLTETNKIMQLAMNNCDVVLGGTTFSASQTEVGLTFKPIADLGSCASYRLSYLDRVVAC